MARKTTCDFCGKEINVAVKTLYGVDYALVSRGPGLNEPIAAFDACQDCLQKVVDTIDSMFLRDQSSH